MAAIKPLRQLQLIEKNKCTISRTEKVKFFDSLRKRAGRQAICNQLDEIFEQFCDKWMIASPLKLQYDFT